MNATRRVRRKKLPENSIGVGSVRTFLDALEEFEITDEDVLYFRGHANFGYRLLPSIYRQPKWIENEDILFKEILLKCPNDFRDQENTFQMLVKMQHYSLPTRLLDLTANPLIGLYFACQQGRSRIEGGEVVVLKIPKRDIRYYDSDTVSVIANISRRPNPFKLPTVKDLEKFNNSKEIKYLLHEIKREKPYFDPKIQREHLGSVVCVKPKLDNPRIIKQEGAFLLFGVNKDKTVPAEISPEYLNSGNRIIVKHLEKRKILDQLRTLGITQGSIYPEIDRVAEYLRDLYGEKDDEGLSKSSIKRSTR